MASSKNKKNISVQKSDALDNQKSEGSTLRNQGENFNKQKNKTAPIKNAGHLKNNKVTGKGFDGSNYYESEQPSIKEISGKEVKQDLKKAIIKNNR